MESWTPWKEIWKFGFERKCFALAGTARVIDADLSASSTQPDGGAVGEDAGRLAEALHNVRPRGASQTARHAHAR
jgi:hypothetical protein